MTARSQRVNVNLKPHVHDAFREIADRKGIPMTTLAALVIADYIDEQSK